MDPTGGMGGGMAGGMGMAADANIPKITKKGKGNAQQEEQEQAPPQMIKLTKLEQQMYKMLKAMNIPYPLFGQYQVHLPAEQRPFVLDFAYPKIGVGVEADGSIWHQREDFVQRDKIRDQKLANVGWRILRFKDTAVEDHSDAVSDAIHKNILEAVKDMKKRANSEEFKKYASANEFMLSQEDSVMNVINLPNNLGKLILIGT